MGETGVTSIQIESENLEADNSSVKINADNEASKQGKKSGIVNDENQTEGKSEFDEEASFAAIEKARNEEEKARIEKEKAEMAMREAEKARFKAEVKSFLAEEKAMLE